MSPTKNSNRLEPDAACRDSGNAGTSKENTVRQCFVDSDPVESAPLYLPSPDIHTGDTETYRPIGEIVAELDVIEAEAKKTDKALRAILEKIGV